MLLTPEAMNGNQGKCKIKPISPHSHIQTCTHLQTHPTTETYSSRKHYFLKMSKENRNNVNNHFQNNQNGKSDCENIAEKTRSRSIDIMPDTMTKNTVTSNMDQIRRVLYPPAFLLAVGGCYLPIHAISTESNSHQIWKRNIKIVHVVFISALHLFHLIRGILFVPLSDIDSGARFVFAVQFSLYTSVWVLLFFTENVACYRHLGKLMKGLKSYQTDFGFRTNFRRLRHVSLIVTVAYAVSLIVVTPLWVSMDTTAYSDFNYYLFPAKFDGSPELVVASYAIGIALMLCWVPVISHLIVYSLFMELLAGEFEVTRDQLDRDLNSKHFESKNMEELFDRSRNRYVSLCQLTSLTSPLARCLGSLMLIQNVNILFFIIYGLSDGDEKHGEQVWNQLFSGVVASSVIGIICWRWGRINSVAHDVIHTVSMCSWQSKSDALLQKMSLFVMSGATTKIGVDMYGLFILDSSTLLMICGTVITYGVVVLQTQLGEDCKAVNLKEYNLTCSVQ